MPENYEDWWAFSGYANLLEFERDACHLCQAVVLFAESGGSLVELGALVADDHLYDRVIAIVQHKYSTEAFRRSFIQLGPLRRLGDSVCTIDATTASEFSQGDFETVLEFVANRLHAPPKSEKLQPENLTHKLLLLADIVDLLQVVRFSEAEEALTFFKASVSAPELERYASLLGFLSLVRLEKRGLHKFLVRNNGSGPWVDYKALSGKRPFDRARFKVEAKQFADGDPARRAVQDRGVTA